MRARTLPQVTWRDQNADGAVQPTELQGVPAAAATPSEGFKRSAFGTDARIHVLVPALGELVLRGELIVAKNLARATMVADPVAARRDLREVGWAVALTQDLTPWAMVGVRHDTFDPDTRALEQPATPGGNAIDDDSFTLRAAMGF